MRKTINVLDICYEAILMKWYTISVRTHELFNWIFHILLPCCKTS